MESGGTEPLVRPGQTGKGSWRQITFIRSSDRWSSLMLRHSVSPFSAAVWTKKPWYNSLPWVVPRSYRLLKWNNGKLAGSITQPDAGVLNDRKQIVTWGEGRVVHGTGRETLSAGMSALVSVENHLQHFRHPAHRCALNIQTEKDQDKRGILYSNWKQNMFE